MMSKDIHKWTDGRYTLMFGEHTFFVWDNEKDKRMTALNVTKKLNEQQATIQELKSDIEETEISIKLFEDDVNRLSKENEQLRQQIQNYEKLIANSYVGEEETLDGFVGKYVIWENELQKYKEKIKKVIDDE